MSGRIRLKAGRCIGCGACTVACMDQNDLAAGKTDQPFRRCVVEERDADGGMDYRSVSCLHCGDAPCVPACPKGCLYRDPGTGFVLYDNTGCVGCRSCARVCPNHAPCFGRDGKMVKCDGCVQRVRRGMLPACVQVCPYGALELAGPEG